MQTTDKNAPDILARALVEHGVKDVVISPGSRNTPLILAVHAQSMLRKTVVIDERSAAYTALGMTQSTGLPTAIICTSGTALLNYAPAVAEAFYQGLPLIVISADRPLEWIDQDDSQTIHQPGALHNFIKGEYELPEYGTAPEMDRYVSRCANEAIIRATSHKQGPVHINVRLASPLGHLIQSHSSLQTVHVLEPLPQLSVAKARELAESIRGKKVMIVAGFMQPDNRLNRYLSLLAKHPDTVILTETISNLHLPEAIANIDPALAWLSDTEKEKLRPDVLITIGGAIVSRHIKQYLRAMPPEQNWRVGIDNNIIDCFLSLTLQINMLPADFFATFSHTMLRANCKNKDSYSHCWKEVYSRAMKHSAEYQAETGWSDMKAFGMVMASLPPKCNLQLSNGTSIRYAQLFPNRHLHTCRCNRGVSGIDGCTSTAIGAAMRSQLPTVLITGDMSFCYDATALGIKNIPSHFRVIVLNNNGGGIFRFISTTSGLNVVEDYFSVSPRVEICKLCEAYGFRYFRAEDETDLRKTLNRFYEDSGTPTLLEIVTPASESAEVLKQYFEN